MKSERTITQINNVTMKVIDADTGRIDQMHSGHNSVTTTLLEGIAHYMQGYGLDNQGMLLKNHLPNFISLGTMGLRNFNPDTSEQFETFDNNGSYIQRPANHQTSQNYVLDSEALDDGINTENFPTDRPTNKAIPDIRAIHGGRLLQTEGVSIDDPDRSHELIPTQNYFTQPPGFDADIRAEVVEYSLDNNGRPKSGIGVPFAQIVEDFDVVEHPPQPCCPCHDSSVCQCTCHCHREPYCNGQSFIEVPTPNPLECELVTHQHGRSMITARRVYYPLSRSDGMNTAESIRSLDVVYTSLVPLGALAAFRGNNDYIFVTGCGLWGNRWMGERYANNNSIPPHLRNKYKAPADLLAGYRIYPPGWSPQDLTVPLTDRNANGTGTTLITAAQRYQRRMRQLQRCILRVGKGQVVQVEWKVQLLALDLSRDLLRQDYTTKPNASLGNSGRALY